MGIFAQLNRQNTVLGNGQQPLQPMQMPAPLNTPMETGLPELQQGSFLGGTTTASPLQTLDPTQDITRSVLPVPQTGGQPPGTLYTTPVHDPLTPEDLTTPYTEDLATLQSQAMEAAAGKAPLSFLEQRRLEEGEARFGEQTTRLGGSTVGETTPGIQRRLAQETFRAEQTQQFQQAKVDRIMSVFTPMASVDQREQDRTVRINEAVNNFALQVGNQQIYVDRFRAELEQNQNQFDKDLELRWDALEEQIRHNGVQEGLTQQQIDNQLTIAQQQFASQAAIAEDQMQNATMNAIVGGATTLGGAYLLSQGGGAAVPAVAAVAPSLTGAAPAVATSYGGGGSTILGGGSYAAGGTYSTAPSFGAETLGASSYTGGGGGGGGAVADTGAGGYLAAAGAAYVLYKNIESMRNRSVRNKEIWRDMTDAQRATYIGNDFGPKTFWITMDESELANMDVSDRPRRTEMMNIWAQQEGITVAELTEKYQTVADLQRNASQDTGAANQANVGAIRHAQSQLALAEERLAAGYGKTLAEMQAEGSTLGITPAALTGLSSARGMGSYFS